MATNIMVVRDGKLHLGPVSPGGADVDCQVSAALIKAAPDPKTLTTMCGKTTVPGVTTYTLEVSAAQDWTTGTGISDYLMQNDGSLVDFVFTPSAATDPSATGKCWVSPGDFGGTVGEIAVLSVVLGIEGKPTITTAP